MRIPHDERNAPNALGEEIGAPRRFRTRRFADGDLDGPTFRRRVEEMEAREAFARDGASFTLRGKRRGEFPDRQRRRVRQKE